MNNFGCAFLLFFLFACSHFRVYEPTGLQSSDFFSEQKRRELQLTNISGKVRLTFSGKQKALSGQGWILVQDQKVRLELSDPFGRVHFIALVDGKDFMAYYPRQKLAYLDKSSGKAFVRDFLGIHFSFADLQRVLQGRLPLTAGNESFQSWEWLGKFGQYKGMVHTGLNSMTCFVDSRTAVLKRLLVASEKGEIDIEYSHFEPCCDSSENHRFLDFAYVVELELKSAGTSLEIEWDNVNLLAAKRSPDVFRVKLGDDVEKVILKDSQEPSHGISKGH